MHLSWEPVYIRLLINIKSGAHVTRMAFTERMSGELVVVWEPDLNVLDDLVQKYGVDHSEREYEFNKGYYRLVVSQNSNSRSSLRYPQIYKYEYSPAGHFFYESKSKEDSKEMKYDVGGDAAVVDPRELDNRLLFIVSLEDVDGLFVYSPSPPYGEQVKRHKDRNWLLFSVTDEKDLEPLEGHPDEARIRNVLKIAKR